MSIDDIKPFKELGSVVCLHKEATEQVDGWDLYFVGDGLLNTEYTASVIEHLDYIITVDSFIAHLAGAMGKKVYLMLPYAQEWRWGKCERIDGSTFVGESYLYKDVNMYRQLEPGKWDDVVNDIIKNVNKDV